MIADKMESGSDRYEVISHAIAGANCDCGYTVSQTYTKSGASNSQYNTNVIRIHKSR
jgi:hypothetical protein